MTALSLPNPNPNLSPNPCWKAHITAELKAMSAEELREGGERYKQLLEVRLHRCLFLRWQRTEFPNVEVGTPRCNVEL